jgi:hypothetical protein
MLSCAAFGFFRNGRPEKILDTDFYAFMGATVRTARNDFIGRLTSTGGAIKAANRLDYPDKETAKGLASTWKYLQERFNQEIDRRKQKE